MNLEQMSSKLVSLFEYLLLSCDPNPSVLHETEDVGCDIKKTDAQTGAAAAG